MTDTINAERNRLQRRLAVLDEERGHIAYALQVLQRVQPPPTGSEPVVEVRQTVRAERSPGGQSTTSDAAFEVIDSEPERAWRAEEIVAAMRTHGWDAQVDNEIETVRAALSRGVKADRIRRVGYGTYGAVNRQQGESTTFNSAPDGAAAVELEEAQFVASTA